MTTHCFFIFSFICSLTIAFISNAAETRLAILEFNNNSGRKELEHLKVGLQDMITTDLNQIQGITLLEREKIEAIIEEQNFSHSDLVNDDTACILGALLGASHLLTGSYIVNNNVFRLDVRLFSVENGEILLTDKIQGPKEEIFDLENRLVTQVAIKIKKDPVLNQLSSRIIYQNNSYDIFERYCRALDFQEQKNYDEARNILEQLEKTDAMSQDIKNKLENLQALIEERKNTDQLNEKEKIESIFSRIKELEIAIQSKTYKPEYFASKLLLAFYIDCADEGKEYQFRLIGGGNTIREYRNKGKDCIDEEEWQEALDEQKARYTRVQNELISFVNEFIEKIKPTEALGTLNRINEIVYGEFDKVSFLASTSYSPTYYRNKQTRAERSLRAKEYRFLNPVMSSIFMRKTDDCLEFNFGVMDDSPERDSFMIYFSDPTNYFLNLLNKAYFDNPSMTYKTLNFEFTFFAEAKEFFKLMDNYLTFTSKANMTNQPSVEYLYTVILQYAHSIKWVEDIPRKDVSGILLHLNHLSELCKDSYTRKELDLFSSKLVRNIKNSNPSSCVVWKDEKIVADDYIFVFSKKIMEEFYARAKSKLIKNSFEDIQKDTMEELLQECTEKNKVNVYVPHKTGRLDYSALPKLSFLTSDAKRKLLSSLRSLSLIATLSSRVSKIEEKYCLSPNIVFTSKQLMEDYASSKSCAVIYIDYVKNEIQISQIDMSKVPEDIILKESQRGSNSYLEDLKKRK